MYVLDENEDVFVQVSCVFIRRCKRDLEARYRRQPEEGRATKPIYKKRTTPVETKPESVATKSESSVARDGSETTVDIETVKVKTVKRIFFESFLHLTIKPKKI